MGEARGNLEPGQYFLAKAGNIGLDMFTALQPVPAAQPGQVAQPAHAARPLLAAMVDQHKFSKPDATTQVDAPVIRRSVANSEREIKATQLRVSGVDVSPSNSAYVMMTLRNASVDLVANLFKKPPRIDQANPTPAQRTRAADYHSFMTTKFNAVVVLNRAAYLAFVGPTLASLAGFNLSFEQRTCQPVGLGGGAAQQAERVACGCGSNLKNTPQNIKAHEKTKKHKRWLRRSGGSGS